MFEMQKYVKKSMAEKKSEKNAFFFRE